MPGNTHDKCSLTPRQEEIQKLACDVMEHIANLACRHLDKLNDGMELTYYLNQISTRMEIIANIRFGLDDRKEP